MSTEASHFFSCYHSTGLNELLYKVHIKWLQYTSLASLHSDFGDQTSVLFLLTWSSSCSFICTYLIWSSQIPNSRPGALSFPSLCCLCLNLVSSTCFLILISIPVLLLQPNASLSELLQATGEYTYSPMGSTLMPAMFTQCQTLQVCCTLVQMSSCCAINAY